MQINVFLLLFWISFIFVFSFHFNFGLILTIYFIFQIYFSLTFCSFVICICHFYSFF